VNLDLLIASSSVPLSSNFHIPSNTFEFSQKDFELDVLTEVRNYRYMVRIKADVLTPKFQVVIFSFPATKMFFRDSFSKEKSI